MKQHQKGIYRRLQAAAVIVFLAPAYLSGQVTDGLVARYTFNNNNGIDDIGHHNARLHEVVPSKDRFGNTGFAYYLQGNMDSYINLGTSPALKPKTGSISLWVKINLVTYNGKGVAGNPILTTKSHNGDDFNEAFSLGYNFNLKHLTVASAISELHQCYVHPDKTSTLLEWHHLVMTFDNHFLCMYLDGVMEGKVKKDFETHYLESDSVLVGVCIDKKNIRFLCGVVDDIEVFNRVLSPNEVLAIYQAPNPNKFMIVLKWMFVVLASVLIALFAFWLIKRYIGRLVERAKEAAKLQVLWYEQENKVLKAQMNPHFIFNSLNTIQQFIIANDNKKARLYLSKFSRLIRNQLESNTKDKISLAEEVDLCERYLEIESLRFNHAFSYSISVEENFDTSRIYIPHFLVQTFLENAIWHGLLPKKGDKKLELSFRLLNKETLCCIIDDNGVGRQKAEEKKKKNHKTSLAISFITQRLLLYSKLRQTEYKLEIIDKINPEGGSDGTKVILTIPIIND